MVDFTATAGRIYGMILRPQATLAFNSQPVPSWRVVAKEHVLPIVAVSAVVNTVLSRALRPYYEDLLQNTGFEVPETGPWIVELAVRVVYQFVLVTVWAVVVGFFAGTLGGRNDFNAAYVLVALALTPYLLSAALVPIPHLGVLLWLCAFVYAMVILYKGVPALVGVPQENRAKHMVLSLVTMLLVTFVTMVVLGPLLTAG